MEEKTPDEMEMAAEENEEGEEKEGHDQALITALTTAENRSSLAV